MKTSIIFSVVMGLFCTSIIAQEVALNPNLGGSKTRTDVAPESNISLIEIKVDWLKSDEVANVPEEETDQHDFGTLVAKKIYLLDKIYTYQVAISPGNPTKKTMLRKPVIYNSVTDVEKYLKKMVRKQELSVNQAGHIFNVVLDIAINTYYVKTDQLEEAISNSKSPEDLLTLYTKTVRILN